ncbi:MAG TPA: ABC transporter ATP-binding protein [Bryobacteraceae bacterium]|nr:ABC transporter ATP-binding protein [Bryobacteraceae bacterium]
MNIVELDRLAKRYGRIDALRSVTLSLEAGEIFGLLGPNGAGKTTLIRMLTGSSRPTGGAVSVFGVDPIRDAARVRRDLGYMPQAPALYEDLSPRDNIRFFGRAHNPPNLEKRIDELLDFSKLRARERDPVYTFSGGMKQRVSLACALVHQPRLVLLDEPTAGVDPRLRAEFWNHFRELARAGATLLVSTHQMDEALYCDRLAILCDGELLACDTPKNLLQRGRTRIHVWRGSSNANESITETEEIYSQALPRVLQQYGLDASVTRIEVERDYLEQIVLKMIQSRRDA